MKYLLLIAVFLFHEPLFGQDVPVDTVVLRVDPEVAMGGTVGKIFEEVTYIPLQNSKQSVIGEISKLEVTDKYFIVFDRGVDQILIFNKDGSYHAKCAGIPGLHKNANAINNFNFNIFGDFALNRAKQEIVVRTSLDRENVFVFNYEGGFKEKIPLGTVNNLKRFWGFAYLDDDHSVYAFRQTSSPQGDDQAKGYILDVFNGSFSEQKKEIYYDRQNIAKGPDIQVTLDGPFYQSGVSSECFFTRSYDYNLYMINGKGINRVYKVLLPEDYSLPGDFLTNEAKYRYKRTEYLLNNRQKVFVINDVYTYGDYLLFKLNNGQYGDKNIFLYNLKTANLLNLLKVTPDTYSSFLPAISGTGAIQACDGKYIYSSISSLELFEANEMSRSKQKQYPSALQTYFSTQTRKSNPVIVQARLHDNL